MKKTPLKIAALFVSISMASLFVSYRSGYFTSPNGAALQIKNNTLLDTVPVMTDSTIKQQLLLNNKSLYFGNVDTINYYKYLYKRLLKNTITKEGVNYLVLPGNFTCITKKFVQLNSTIYYKDSLEKKLQIHIKSMTKSSTYASSSKSAMIYDVNEESWNEYPYIFSYENEIPLQTLISSNFSITPKSTPAISPRFSGSKSAVLIQRKDVERPKPKKVEIPNFFPRN